MGIWQLELRQFLIPPISLAFSWSLLSLLGRWRRKRNFSAGYSRKVCHFTFFLIAIVLRWYAEPVDLMLFGAGASMPILLAVFIRPQGNMIRALAREEDGVDRYRLVWEPWLATSLGGLVVLWLWPQWSIIAFAVTGLADALAEPVGLRWGRHPLKLPMPWLAKSRRTWEGSLSVVLVACLVFVTFQPVINWPNLGFSLAGGLWIGLLEALSPRGWDNGLLQVGTAIILGLMNMPL